MMLLWSVIYPSYQLLDKKQVKKTDYLLRMALLEQKQDIAENHETPHLLSNHFHSHSHSSPSPPFAAQTLIRSQPTEGSRTAGTSHTASRSMQGRASTSSSSSAQPSSTTSNLTRNLNSPWIDRIGALPPPHRPSQAVPSFTSSGSQPAPSKDAASSSARAITPQPKKKTVARVVERVERSLGPKAKSLDKEDKEEELRADLKELRAEKSQMHARHTKLTKEWATREAAWKSLVGRMYQEHYQAAGGVDKDSQTQFVQEFEDLKDGLHMHKTVNALTSAKMLNFTNERLEAMQTAVDEMFAKPGGGPRSEEVNVDQAVQKAVQEINMTVQRALAKGASRGSSTASGSTASTTQVSFTHTSHANRCLL